MKRLSVCGFSLVACFALVFAGCGKKTGGEDKDAVVVTDDGGGTADGTTVEDTSSPDTGMADVAVDSSSPDTAAQDTGGNGKRDTGKQDTMASGPGTIDLDIEIPAHAQRAYSVQVYDASDGSFVAGILGQQLSAAGKSRLKLLGVDSNNCLNQTAASVPEGEYRAYFALDTDGATETSKPDACSGSGFITDAEKVARIDLKAAGGANLKIRGGDLVSPEGDQVDISNSAAAEGQAVVCTWHDPANTSPGPDLGSLGLVVTMSVRGGTATLSETPHLPPGQYMLHCLGDIKMPYNDFNTGDEYAHKKITYDGSAVSVSSWMTK